MAYAALPAKNATDTLDLADYNKIKGNFEASAIDIVTAKGQLAVATGADALTPLTVGANDTTLVPDSGQASGLAWQIQPAARVYNSALIDPATSSWVSLTFDSERFDTDTCHSTVSNTGRLTVPANGDGLYLIGGSVQLGSFADTGGLLGIRILLNGATVIAGHTDVRGATQVYAVSISTLYSLVATNYVELQVYTTDNVNVELQANYSPEFWFQWVRRA